jgi:hypothetical protein
VLDGGADVDSTTGVTVGAAVAGAALGDPEVAA